MGFYSTSKGKYVIFIYIRNEANLSALEAGETLTVTLPISGNFSDDSIITGINLAVAHPKDNLKISIFNNAKITLTNMEFPINRIADEPPVIVAPSFKLEGEPNFTFNGNNWDPQLIIKPTEAFSVPSDTLKVQFEIKIPDYSTLRPLMSWGSRETAISGSFGYGPSDLGIYFAGTSNIGITQGNLFAAFDDNSEALSAGETVTLTLPVTGTFKDDDIITAVKFMITHGDNAAQFASKDVSISNFEFVRKTENNILSDGQKYTFSGGEWWPQLTVKTTSSIAVSAQTRRIKFDIRIPDYETLYPLMTYGSREVAGGGSFGYGGSDLGIYFSGEGFSNIGVTQGVLYSAFDANKEALSQGKRVTLNLPISGTFKEGDVITAVNLMVTHGANAAAFNGKFIALSNVELLPFEYDSAYLDCDEKVTASDLVIIKKLLFATDVTVANKNEGDVNGDGAIDILDYVTLYEKTLGL